VPISSFFGNVQRFAGQKLGEAQRAYQQLDRATGGWLPGGGAASPITKAISPAQSFPKRSEELERATGVKARFIAPDRTPTLVRRIAPLISQEWGDADYANPLLNEVGMTNYQGGKSPEERYIEYHELGHLNPKDKGIYSYAGILGRGLEGISARTGNFPPLDIAAGLALKYADAPEEDRAERFAARFAKEGNYRAPEISSTGTSGYGDRLRREGSELVSRGVQKVVNPWGLTDKVSSFVNQQRAQPALREYDRLTPLLKTAIRGEKGDAISAETLKLRARHDQLEQQLKNLGVSEDELWRRFTQ
jgi:hypothetical protein